MLCNPEHLHCCQMNANAFKPFKSTFLASIIYSNKNKEKSILTTSISAPRHLQRFEAPQHQPPISTLQPLSNQISSLPTCMSGPITYWKSVRLEMRMPKHVHIHKGIWTTFGMRWPHALFVFPLIVIFLLGSYKRYGITFIPLWTNVVALF